MFGSKKTSSEEENLKLSLDRAIEKATVYQNALEKERVDHSIDIRKLEAEHELELKKKDFELAHQVDNRVKKLEEEKVTLSTQLAVANKQIEMMKSIVDLSADMVDVKDIMSKIIAKLPEINLSSISTSNITAKK